MTEYLNVPWHERRTSCQHLVGSSPIKLVKTDTVLQLQPYTGRFQQQQPVIRDDE